MNSHEILETELAPLIDLHKPGVPEAIKKLVAQVRNETREEIASLVAQSYYMDESGVEPMSPTEIAQVIRDTNKKPLALVEEKI